MVRWLLPTPRLLVCSCDAFYGNRLKDYSNFNLIRLNVQPEAEVDRLCVPFLPVKSGNTGYRTLTRNLGKTAAIAFPIANSSIRGAAILAPVQR